MRAGRKRRTQGDLASLPVPLDLEPMEAKLVESLPEGSGWQFEPKWDGFRCLAFRAGNEIALQSRTGKPLGRYFPEIEALLRALPASIFVVDGELAIPMAESLSFDALQMRVHPAETRVRRLASETPAVLILFDCLVSANGARLIERSLLERRKALEAFHRSAQEAGEAAAALRLSPYTRDRRQARRWLENARGALDGVVAKRLADPYQPGQRAMLKVKPLRTADCVVGGFRYGTGSREVGSLLLGLYDAEGKLHHVGFTSTLAHADRRELTRRLQALIEPPGFTGDAPGGPSRWSTERSSEWEPLRAKLVAEVVYDQVTGNRFRHGTRLMRWRPDKSPRQCTFDQLQREARPGKLVRQMLEP